MPQTNCRAKSMSGHHSVPVTTQFISSGSETPINELLHQLSAYSLAGVLRYAERVSLDRRQVIQERNMALRYVYFIESGVASLLAKAGGGRANVEIRTLGFRDFVGLPLLHGVEMSPHRCTLQEAGQALRIGAVDFAALLTEFPEFQRLLLRYAHDVCAQNSQLVACNVRHSLRQRLSRWLLVASDRLEADRIGLTHDNLSRAIAVRRAGATTEMGRMEQAGLIMRRRGTILILDRDGLENISCNCHRILRGMGKAARPAWRGQPTAEAATVHVVDEPLRHERFECSVAA